MKYCIEITKLSIYTATYQPIFKINKINVFLTYMIFHKHNPNKNIMFGLVANTFVQKLCIYIFT